MIEPSSVARLVSAHVRLELARDADVERVAARLHERLTKLVGPGGFDVLLARALLLAKRGHPVLVGVDAGPGGMLVGLGDAARDPVAVEHAVTAIVANFIELLVVFIGEELTMRLLHEVVEEASSGARAPAKDRKK